MTFHQKLARRVEELGLNKTKAAREVGLPESTIGSYISKPVSLPRSDIALKISRAIQVPLEWLVDDAADWPPPSPTTNAAAPSLTPADHARALIHHAADALPDSLVFVVASSAAAALAQQEGGDGE